MPSSGRWVVRSGSFRITRNKWDQTYTLIDPGRVTVSLPPNQTIDVPGIAHVGPPPPPPPTPGVSKFYLAGGQYAWASDDGSSWVSWGPPAYLHENGFTYPDEVIATPRFAPTGKTYFGDAGGKIWETSDGLVSVPTLLHDFTIPITQIHVSPLDEDVVTVLCNDYSGFGDRIGYIFQSIDAGVTWALKGTMLDALGQPYRIYRIEQNADGTYYGIGQGLDPPSYDNIWVRFSAGLSTWEPVLDTVHDTDINGVESNPQHRSLRNGAVMDAGLGGAYGTHNPISYLPQRGGYLTTFHDVIDDARPHQSGAFLSQPLVEFYEEVTPGPIGGVYPLLGIVAAFMLGGIPIENPDHTDRSPHAYGMYITSNIGGTEVDNLQLLDAEPLDYHVSEGGPGAVAQGETIIYMTTPWEGGVTYGVNFGFTAEEEAIADIEIRWSYPNGPEAHKWFTYDSAQVEVPDSEYDITSGDPYLNYFSWLFSTSTGVYAMSFTGGSGDPRFWQISGATMTELPTPTYVPALEEGQDGGIGLPIEDPGTPGRFFFIMGFERFAWTDDEFATIHHFIPTGDSEFLSDTNFDDWGVSPTAWVQP